MQFLDNGCGDTQNVGKYIKCHLYLQELTDR